MADITQQRCCILYVPRQVFLIVSVDIHYINQLINMRNIYKDVSDYFLDIDGGIEFVAIFDASFA